jgi:AraC-like DNA-binding protein
MRAAKELTGDAALALHFGEAFDIQQLSVVALLSLSCETIAEAFEQLGRYTKLLIDVEVDDSQGRRLVFSRENGRLWLVDTRRNPNDFPELTESGFARMAAASRLAPGQAGWIAAVHVTHPAPSYAAEYERVFRVPVIFGSDRNALLMKDDSILTMQVPRPQLFAFGALGEHADDLLKDLDAAKTTRGRVEGLLLPMLPTGKAGVTAVASKMGVSRQTLFRRLKAEGTTFEKVLDDLRRRLALDHLNGKKVSIGEAAYLVGFSDAVAFSRAVKRWTGATPRAWRAQSSKA